MRGIRIIPDSGFKTTEWSGGTTTELFIWPEGGSYAERRFNIRISTAVVELEESDFTPLPGVKRFLTPLCPGFVLTVNGDEKELPYGEALEFSGDDSVHCKGSGRDLNLMLKGAEGDMRIAEGAFTIEKGRTAFLFSKDQQTIAYCGLACPVCSSALLPALSFAKIEPGSFRSERPVVLFILDI